MPSSSLVVISRSDTELISIFLLWGVNCTDTTHIGLFRWSNANFPKSISTLLIILWDPNGGGVKLPHPVTLETLATTAVAKN